MSKKFNAGGLAPTTLLSSVGNKKAFAGTLKNSTSFHHVWASNKNEKRKNLHLHGATSRKSVQQSLGAKMCPRFVTGGRGRRYGRALKANKFCVTAIWSCVALVTDISLEVWIGPSLGANCRRRKTVCLRPMMNFTLGKDWSADGR